jgi:hypothetical protein
MKRWLLIAVAAVLTLGALTFFDAPAMARDFHPRREHEPAHVYRARHDAHAWRAGHFRTAHGHAPRHSAHRR